MKSLQKIQRTSLWITMSIMIVYFLAGTAFFILRFFTAQILVTSILAMVFLSLALGLILRKDAARVMTMFVLSVQLIVAILLSFAPFVPLPYDVPVRAAVMTSVVVPSFIAIFILGWGKSEFAPHPPSKKDNERGRGR